MAVHKMESLRFFTSAQGGGFLSSGVSRRSEKKSAVAQNSSSREVIRKYTTSALRARSLQTAACPCRDDSVAVGGPQPQNR